MQQTCRESKAWKTFSDEFHCSEKTADKFVLYLFVVLWVHRWDMAPASLFGFTSDDGMKAGLTLPTQSEVRNTAHVFSEPSFLHFWLGGNNHPPILCVLVFGWGESTRHKFMLYICIFVQICVDVQRLDPCRTDDKTSASVRLHVCRLVAPMFCTTSWCVVGLMFIV